MRNKPSPDQPTEYRLSKSELKRRAERVEELAQELVKLPESVLRHLPCEPWLKDEITRAKDLKTGARKRQIKYLAKELRKIEPEPLYLFLEAKRGSQLKQNLEHHEIEHLRDAILTDAIEAFEEIRYTGEALLQWKSPALVEAGQQFPRLDIVSIRSAAAHYAHTRKPVYSHEIFRQLKSAQEQLQRAEKQE
ncbi:MAG: hypothetical protein A2511_11490 [Deltaproteobacteria bacterium RIFOXYD12_FULL_50_9]|nr:MAG: hypothetical protein A2511_11490 [Deltaproteobacteria bacterium RIFOXYD12_FULL_50_9]